MPYRPGMNIPQDEGEEKSALEKQRARWGAIEKDVTEVKDGVKKDVKETGGGKGEPEETEPTPRGMPHPGLEPSEVKTGKSKESKEGKKTGESKGGKGEKSKFFASGRYPKEISRQKHFKTLARKYEKGKLSKPGYETFTSMASGHLPTWGEYQAYKKTRKQGLGALSQEEFTEYQQFLGKSGVSEEKQPTLGEWKRGQLLTQGEEIPERWRTPEMKEMERDIKVATGMLGKAVAAYDLGKISKEELGERAGRIQDLPSISEKEYGTAKRAVQEWRKGRKYQGFLKSSRTRYGVTPPSAEIEKASGGGLIGTLAEIPEGYVRAAEPFGKGLAEFSDWATEQTLGGEGLYKEGKLGTGWKRTPEITKIEEEFSPLSLVGRGAFYYGLTAPIGAAAGGAMKSVGQPVAKAVTGAVKGTAEELSELAGVGGEAAVSETTSGIAGWAAAHPTATQLLAWSPAIGYEGYRTGKMIEAGKTPMEIGRHVATAGGSMAGFARGMKWGLEADVPRVEYQKAGLEGEPVYKGLYGRKGTTAKPLIGKTQKGWRLGTPSLGGGGKGRLLQTAISRPLTAYERPLYTKNLAKFETPQGTLGRTGVLSARGTTYGRTAPNKVQSVDDLVDWKTYKSRFDLADDEIRAIKNAMKQESKIGAYGSRVSQKQMKGVLGRRLGDIDVKVENPKAFASEVASEIKGASVEGTSVVKGGHHLLDVKPISGAGYGGAPQDWWGFTPEEWVSGKGGLEEMPLSEAASRKGPHSILQARVTPKGITFKPEPHRAFKDISDFLNIEASLGAPKGALSKVQTAYRGVLGPDFEITGGVSAEAAAPSVYSTGLTTPTVSPTISPSSLGISSLGSSPSPILSPSAGKISPSVTPSLAPSVSPTPSEIPSFSPSISSMVGETPSSVPSVSPSVSPSIGPSPSVPSPSITPSVSTSVSPSVSPPLPVSPSVTPSPSPPSPSEYKSPMPPSPPSPPPPPILPSDVGKSEEKREEPARSYETGKKIYWVPNIVARMTGTAGEKKRGEAPEEIVITEETAGKEVEEIFGETDEDVEDLFSGKGETTGGEVDWDLI